MAHPYPKHLDSFDYAGKHAYFLTFVTFERTPHFIDAEAVALVHAQILRAAGEAGFTAAAYCFMPDHLHLLMRGERDDADGRQFISLAKQYSGYYFSQARHSRLWRRYGYERVVRDEAEWIATVEYILDNPVKAGLVARREDHPFSGFDGSVRFPGPRGFHPKVEATLEGTEDAT